MQPSTGSTADDSERRYDECMDCGTRTLPEAAIDARPTRGGTVRNIAVPRE